METPTRDEVIHLMKSSKNDQDWRINCDKVKEMHGGYYPNYWYDTFIASGLSQKIMNDPEFGKMKIFTGKDFDDLFNVKSSSSLRKKYGFED